MLTRRLACTFALFSLASSSLSAFPPSAFPVRGGQNLIIHREAQGEIEELSQRLNSHEIELRAIKEKFRIMNDTLETLQSSLRASQSKMQNTVDSLEMRLGSVEFTLKGLSTNMHQLKNHSDEYETKMLRLENIVEAQTQNMGTLESSIRALTEAIQEKKGIFKDVPPLEKKGIAPSLEKEVKANPPHIKKD